MSAKSAQNGQLPKAPTDRPASMASRVALLEQRLSSVIGIVDQMSALLARLLENQAVAATLPTVEQQLRGQIQRAYAQDGLGAFMGQPSQPQQGAPQPQQPQDGLGSFGEAPRPTTPPQQPQGATQPG
jgi:nitric oxide reductase activation protein